MSIALLWVTGILWWFFDVYRGEMGPSVAQAWSLRAHGIFAMVGLVFFGSALAVHVRIGWMLRGNRSLGVSFGGVLVLLALSGCGLYYFSGDALRNATSWLHFIAGLVLPAFLIVHIVAGRAAARAAATHSIASH